MTGEELARRVADKSATDRDRKRLGKLLLVVTSLQVGG